MTASTTAILAAVDAGVDGRELGRFLRSCRARLTPERAGIEPGPRRRVTGLRREEVAQLAGISVEYYVRLEQGRARRPSDEILDAVARVLRLTDTERVHLRDLSRRDHGPAPAADRVRPELADLLAALADVPAILLNHRTDVLAANPLALAVYGWMRPGVSNMVRYCFRDPGARDFFPDWPDIARAMVAQLRLTAGRHPDDAALASLVGELAIADATFRDLWAGREVRVRGHGTKRLRHPVVGVLTLRYENFDLPDGPGLRLSTLHAAPGSPDEDALRMLASWSAPTGPEVQRAEDRP